NFTPMKLGFGIRFGDLYEREGLMRLDAAFLRFLGEADTALHDRLLAARQNPAIKDESDLLVALAPRVEDFLPKLFGIEAQAGALFKAPRKLDYLRLIPVHSEAKNGFPEHSSQHLRHRDGFKLTDGGTDLVGALDEANYCIWCHSRERTRARKASRKSRPPRDS